jgi:hypothetical protein
MNRRFLHFRHRIEGEITFDASDADVHFHCRWPFEVSKGEWISVSQRFPLKDWRSNIQRLGEQDEVTISSRQEGALVLKRLGANRVRLQSVERFRNATSEIELTLPVSCEELLPAQGPSIERIITDIT